MLAIAVSNETIGRLYESDISVKVILPVLENSKSVGKRLVEAFGTDDKEYIAKILGFKTVGGLYKVLSGERELDFEKLQRFRNHTKRTIDWLLTGVDEPPAPRETPIPDESPIELRIRQIVRDELAAAMVPVQDLGAVDEFDIASAVKKYDNAIPVLRDWYAHDKLPMPADLNWIPFEGWDRMNLDEKVHEVKAVRKSIDEDRKFRELLNKTAHATRTTKKKI
jgi:hypothetical protein